MATTLEAINEILNRAGERSAVALDPTGPSDVFDAEAFLGRSRLVILREGPFQMGGWPFSTDFNLELPAPDISSSLTSITGTFQVGEILSQAGGFTGRLNDLDSSNIATLTTLTGTIAGLTAITGDTSGATATTGIPSEITEGRIAIPLVPAHLAWRATFPDQRNPGGAVESKRLALRGMVFYNIETATFIFDQSIRIDRAFDVDFASIPGPVQTYITRHAAVEFQRYRRRDRDADRDNIQAMLEAKTDAYRLADAESPSSIFRTARFERLLGGRRWPSAR